MGRHNHHAVGNGDVKVQDSDYPFESTLESVTDQYITRIKSIDDY